MDHDLTTIPGARADPSAGAAVGWSLAIIGIHAGPALSSGAEDQPRLARQGGSA
jgi:hypothetical protein